MTKCLDWRTVVDALLTWYLLRQLVHRCQSLRNPHTLNVINLLISFSVNESTVLSIKCHLIITWGLCHRYFLHIRWFLIFSMKEQSDNQILMSDGPLLNVKWLFSASEVSQPYVSPQYPDYCTRTGFNKIHNRIIRYGVSVRRLSAQIASTMEMNKRISPVSCQD